MTKKKRSLRNEKLRVNRASETEEQRKERLRIEEKMRKWENRKPRCPLSKDWSEVKLKRNLRLEKVVASKQLRLAVETEEERRTRLEAFLKSWQLCLSFKTWCSNNIDTHNGKKYRSWFIVCFSYSSWYVPNNFYIITRARKRAG